MTAPGHPKACQCEACIKAKVAEYLTRIHDTSRLVPDGDQTVPVRAHWRRQPGHLRKQPKLRTALLAELAELRKKR